MILVKKILVIVFLFFLFGGTLPAQVKLYKAITEFNNEEERITDSLLRLSEKYSRSALDTSMLLAKQTLKIALDHQLPRQEGFAEYFLGRGNGNRGEWAISKHHFQKAIKAFRVYGDSLFVAFAMDKIGYAHRELGELPQALDAHLKGLELRQKFDDSPLNIAYSFASVGGIYRMIEDYETAMDYFQNAFKIRTENQDTLGMAHSNVGIGRVYEKTNDLDKALNSYEAALNLYKHIEFHSFISNTYRLIGSVYTKKGAYEKANSSFEEAAQIAVERNNFGRLGFIYNNMGELYFKQKKYDRAIEYFKESIKYLIQTNSTLELEGAYRGLARSYKVIGDYQSSLQYFELQAQLKDRIFTSESDRRLAIATTQFKTEQKEKENIQLRYERYGLMLGSLILLSLLFFLIWAYRSRRKAYVDLLLEKNKVEALLQEKEKLLEDLKETQLQLIHAEKMASIGQLTAGIAHEINNPINFISSNVYALKMDIQDINKVLDKLNQIENVKDKEKGLKDLILMGKNLETNYLKQEMIQLTDSIERGVQRTKNIVSSLRVFSRKGDEVFAKADIHEGLDSSLVILKNKLGKNIHVKKAYAALPKIDCQIGRLSQVFLNVIENSIDAMNGEGELYIETKKVNNHISIIIKDTGEGIDATTQQRIFEPFFTTKPIGKGTGLGLSISYGIINDHQGKITVDSARGSGTQFNIKIPMQQLI